MNKGYVIYKVTNKINGKIYIGKTNNFEKRKIEHTKYDINDNSIFHRALKKYGEEKFEWAIIDFADNLKEINELEKYYIKKFRTYKPNGYNMTKGGDGGSMWNARPVVCLDLSGKYIKRYDSAMQANKEDGFCASDMLLCCKGKISKCRNHMFMFEDDYLKNGARKYVEPKPNRMRAVVQCDKEGKIIARYESVSEAAKNSGANRTTISGVLNGTYKTANGFIFVYGENLSKLNVEQHKARKKGRKIVQINPRTGDVVKTFQRIADAGRELRVSYKAIHKVVDVPERTAYGFIWKSA